MKLSDLMKGKAPHLPTPLHSSAAIDPKLLQAYYVGTADPNAGEQIISKDEAEQWNKTDVLRRMNSAVEEQRKYMGQIAKGLPEILKGLSPTALAKVIARDAELTDLITKALFLVPAFTQEKTDDRS